MYMLPWQRGKFQLPTDAHPVCYNVDFQTLENVEFDNIASFNIHFRNFVSRSLEDTRR